MYVNQIFLAYRCSQPARSRLLVRRLAHAQLASLGTERVPTPVTRDFLSGPTVEEVDHQSAS